SPTVHRSISFLFVSSVYLLNSYGSFYTRPLSYLIHMLDLVFLLVVLYGECLTVYLYDSLLFPLNFYIFHIRGYYHASLFLVYSSTLLSYIISFYHDMFETLLIISNKKGHQILSDVPRLKEVKSIDRKISILTYYYVYLWTFST